MIAVAERVVLDEELAGERRVRVETGHTRVHVNLFVDSDNIRDLDGVETTVPAGSDVSIIPAISGG